MSNMSYCRFENTARDLRDCIYAIEERDVYEFSSHELQGFKDLIEAAQELGRMDYETDKILEYYESADTE
tara:strand:- start:193 stop:402 length:210 start_codon:yes stop_codon:yes gene_type:complete